MNKIVALSTVAAVPAASPSIGAVPLAMHGEVHPVDNALDALWLERQANVRQAKAIYRRLDDALERMPAWAKSGPEYIDANGERCGHTVSWPEVAQLPAPPEISFARRLIRVSPQHIKENFENYVSLYPGNSKRALRLRAKARENYRASMRQLIARLRERREIERGLKIPEIEARAVRPALGH